MNYKKKGASRRVVLDQPRKRIHYSLLAWQCAGVIFFLTLLSSIFLGLSWLRHPNVLSFNRLELTLQGSNIDSRSMRLFIASNLNGGFFSLDELGLSKKIKQNPWVKSVTIRKVFPDMLKIGIQEYHPVAYWGAQILTSSGRLLDVPSNVRLVLPKLSGPPNFLQETWLRYQLLNEIAQPKGLSVQALSVSPSGSWTVTLYSGPKVSLGAKYVIARFKQFMDCYAQLLATHPGGAMLTVDLRYSNAIAVRWAKMALS